MSEWRTFQLNEIYDFASGLSKSRDEFGFGFPFLSFMEVFNNYFVPRELKLLANTTSQERQRCSINLGDVFLTRTSETQEDLGMSCVALKDYPNATFNGFTKRLRPKGKVAIHPEFVGFYFRSPKFRAEVTSMSSITTRASLNNEMLAALKLTLPPLPEQRAIASVLSSLDDKIDLLHRQNKTLEAMAETLFRQWFVEEAGEESLERRTIAELVDKIQYGYTQSASSQPIGPRFLRITDIQGGQVNWENVPYCEAPRDAVEKYRLHTGDIVIARTGASTGENYYCYKPPISVFASYLIRLQCNDLELSRYIAMHTRSAEYQEYISGILSGSAQPNANAQELTSFELLKPSRKKLKKFYEAVIPLDEKKYVNTNQIRTLEKLRNTLLPKLMSGEVRVQYD